jgi:hypothetical protein
MQAINNNLENSYKTIQVNEYLLNELEKRYSKLMLTKEELAEVLNQSPRTISNKMSVGTLDIKFIKFGNSKQSGVMFPVFAVAEYLTKKLCEPFQMAA